MRVKINSIRSTPFFIFVMTGGFSAIVNIAARHFFSLFFKFEYAVILAFPFGMTTAYILSRLFVFPGQGKASVIRQYGRFTLINLMALVQVWLVSIGLAKWLFPSMGFVWNAELVAHIVGVASPILTSYYGHKIYTFRR